MLRTRGQIVFFVVENNVGESNAPLKECVWYFMKVGPKGTQIDVFNRSAVKHEEVANLLHIVEKGEIDLFQRFAVHQEPRTDDLDAAQSREVDLTQGSASCEKIISNGGDLGTERK